jgi:hypothetical protein
VRLKKPKKGKRAENDGEDETGGLVLVWVLIVSIILLNYTIILLYYYYSIPLLSLSLSLLYYTILLRLGMVYRGISGVSSTVVQ